MFDIRVFRFDPKIDILSYFKPYFYEKLEFTSLRNLLNDIKANDPYFDFSNIKFAKINDFVVSLDENLQNLTEKFGKKLVVSPLSEKYSYKDLNFYDTEFKDKFAEFNAFCDEKDRAFYETLAPSFYGSVMREFSENFFGNSGFVFAKYLCEKYPEKKEQICKFVKEQTAYFVPSKTINIDNGKSAFEYFCAEFGSLPQISKPICECAEILANFDKKDFKHAFNEFCVCIYDDENLEKLAQNLGAKTINFKFKNFKFNTKILDNFDTDCALKIASSILFNAYDGGGDFLVVNDEKIFDFFDGESDKICEFAGRNLHNFYILKSDEFLALAKDEKPKSLKNHKLKVALI